MSSRIVSQGAAVGAGPERAAGTIKHALTPAEIKTRANIVSAASVVLGLGYLLLLQQTGNLTVDTSTQANTLLSVGKFVPEIAPAVAFAYSRHVSQEIPTQPKQWATMRRHPFPKTFLEL